MRAPQRIAIVAITVLMVFATYAADCGRQIAASGPAARTIVLAGGNAWSLFRQFLSEVEQRNLQVSLRKSKIILSHEGRIETIELRWSGSLPGGTAEDRWQDKLRGKHADINPQLLADARVSNWDIICVGQSKPPTPPDQPPQEAVIFYKSGVQFASRGDYANALKEFTAAEKISPRLNGLLANLGATHLQLKDYVRASAYLRRAVEHNPRDTVAHYNMACLQARLGQHADAIASLTAAKASGMKLTAAQKRDPDLASLRGRRDFESLFQ